MSSISSVSTAQYAVATQANSPKVASSSAKPAATSGGASLPADSVTLSASKAASSAGLDSDHDGDVDKAGQPDKDSAAVSARAFQQQQLAKVYSAS